LVNPLFFKKDDSEQPKIITLKTSIITIDKIESFQGDPEKIIIGIKSTVKSEEFFKFEKHETALIIDEVTEKVKKYLKGPWPKGV
jgi:hypothetical protein